MGKHQKQWNIFIVLLVRVDDINFAANHKIEVNDDKNILKQIRNDYVSNTDHPAATWRWNNVEF